MRKNGSSAGEAKYQCTACRHQTMFSPAAPACAAQRAHVDQLLEEHNLQRSIARVTGAARMTIARCSTPQKLDSLWRLS